jgi:DNA invertase Pin-like site-specific DNA recombinase
LTPTRRHAARGGRSLRSLPEGLGWKALPARYDDLGLSGKNTDRPQFQKMLRDIEAGLIDVVAVYKIDRLSRSVADFTRLMEDFDRRGVTFVSVTQAFDTRTSMGRLTLNILGSFAQFERERIADRVRDSMLAARKRGSWTGGRPLLGYDIVDGALVVNELEAAIVRELFLSYLQRGSLNAVVDECRRRGITNKTFVNRSGERVQGGPIAKTTLRALLSNPLFVGRINADGDAVRGNQPRIVDESALPSCSPSPGMPHPADVAERLDEMTRASGRPGAGNTSASQGLRAPGRRKLTLTQVPIYWHTQPFAFGSLGPTARDCTIQHSLCES